MPRRLNWLPTAFTDLVRLREFIQIHNPAAAGRAAHRIREAAGQLLDYPHLGKGVDGMPPSAKKSRKPDVSLHGEREPISSQFTRNSGDNSTHFVQWFI
ncbi:hypothetical protein METHB2_590021 [Candidatus Methylobacter favarea]|uniref:Type II toxin-antitoxin system RelE/ParE family toxin n=1 Tax=Candidatus Methylobacter favarea TaxID=2707345 RepID=A0A8S0WC14_9GAMM|nr:hypothetical protein METHB2_590021 [Candidatus Methylobacter favarea]